MNRNTNAQLVVIESGRIKTYNLDDDQVTIGRIGGANDVPVNAKFVSSQHGMITYYNGIYVYIDLASTNGTTVDGRYIRCQGGVPSNPIPLKDGDVLSIGSPSVQDKVYMIFSNAGTNVEWNIIPVFQNPRVTIGRGLDNNIVIPSITASRKHAEIVNNNGVVSITDLSSVNGTFLNGTLVRGSAEFTDLSIVRIENAKFIRVGNYIVYSKPMAQSQVQQYSSGGSIQSAYVRQSGFPPGQVQGEPPRQDFNNQGGVEVIVENISRMVSCKNGTGEQGGNKKYILRNVSLTINPGELIAILGGSGAGKTTFMNCINGFEPATEGRVLVDGLDLYKNYQSLKSCMGYVPQQDIVHDNLTLEAMLTYTGKLRLPSDVTKQELSTRVAEVLEMVDLTKEKDTFIRKLSGGQRKRASIAVELVSDPSLFFLDEPTSGLDPEAETNLMHQLRRLSDQNGKTVIVITHTLQNIRLFDKVIFLAPGGKLCFYGTPAEAEKFFEVDNLADAYEKISDDIDGYVQRYNAYAQRGVNIYE